MFFHTRDDSEKEIIEDASIVRINDINQTI
jgi:hypothetical protein